MYVPPTDATKCRCGFWKNSDALIFVWVAGMQLHFQGLLGGSKACFQIASCIALNVFRVVSKVNQFYLAFPKFWYLTKRRRVSKCLSCATHHFISTSSPSVAFTLHANSNVDLTL